MNHKRDFICILAAIMAIHCKFDVEMALDKAAALYEAADKRWPIDTGRYVTEDPR